MRWVLFYPHVTDKETEAKGIATCSSSLQLVKSQIILPLQLPFPTTFSDFSIPEEFPLDKLACINYTMVIN